jgi:hypothetical protein
LPLPFGASALRRAPSGGRGSADAVLVAAGSAGGAVAARFAGAGGGGLGEAVRGAALPEEALAFGAFLAAAALAPAGLPVVVLAGASLDGAFVEEALAFGADVDFLDALGLRFIARSVFLTPTAYLFAFVVVR